MLGFSTAWSSAFSFSQVCSLASWRRDRLAGGWLTGWPQPDLVSLPAAASQNKVVQLFMIYMLPEGIGNFFQIWSLATSIRIFVFVQFDAVVCNLLRATNLGMSGQQQIVQNAAVCVVSKAPHRQPKVFCCPSRLPWFLYHICNWHQKKTREVNFLWRFHCWGILH